MHTDENGVVGVSLRAPGRSCFGARVCDPQQCGQPEGTWNELKRFECSPLLRLTEPRSGAHGVTHPTFNSHLCFICVHLWLV
jgi:hypothetical protein